MDLGGEGRSGGGRGSERPVPLATVLESALEVPTPSTASWPGPLGGSQDHPAKPCQSHAEWRAGPCPLPGEPAGRGASLGCIEGQCAGWPPAQPRTRCFPPTRALPAGAGSYDGAEEAGVIGADILLGLPCDYIKFCAWSPLHPIPRTFPPPAGDPAVQTEESFLPSIPLS